MRTSFTSQPSIDRTHAALWFVLMVLASWAVLAKPAAAHSTVEQALAGAHSQPSILAAERAASLHAPHHRRDGTLNGGNPGGAIAAALPRSPAIHTLQSFEHLHARIRAPDLHSSAQPRAPPSFARLH